MTGAEAAAGTDAAWWLTPASYGVLRAGGALLEVSLNRVSERDGGVHKRRRTLMPARLVNLGLALLRCGVRYLEDDAWLAWERALHAATTGAAVQGAPGGLWTQRLPGVVLSRYLEATRATAAFAALEGAFRALGSLHAQVVRWPDGALRPASHSDATAKNVLWDEASGRAAWFDFETIHEASWPESRRRIDDLRALAFSAARAAEPELVVRAMRAGYPEKGASREVAASVRRLPLGEALFHLSQAPLAHARFERMLSALEGR